jgi:hypothetical protein
MDAKDIERQLELTKELAELLHEQLEAMKDGLYLGWSQARDDAARKRSERIRALRQELAAS